MSRLNAVNHDLQPRVTPFLSRNTCYSLSRIEGNQLLLHVSPKRSCLGNFAIFATVLAQSHHVSSALDFVNRGSYGVSAYTNNAAGIRPAQHRTRTLADVSIRQTGIR